MIKLEHVSKSYSAGIPALNDISLNIEEGEFVFIVGNSGSGKSTLIKLLLKELEPTKGVITINNRNLNAIRRKQIPKYRRNVGVVFQDFRLLKDRNVYENIAFAQKVVEAPNRKIKSRVLAMLSMVGLLDKYKAFPNELSGGEQQRVILARALTQTPQCLLLDEPTNHLDIKYQLQLLDIVKWQSCTVCAVLHDLNLACKYCDKIAVIKDGKLFTYGTPKEVITEKFIKEVYEVDSKIVDFNGRLVVIYN